MQNQGGIPNTHFCHQAVSKVLLVPLSMEKKENGSQSFFLLGVWAGFKSILILHLTNSLLRLSPVHVTYSYNQLKSYFFWCLENQISGLEDSLSVELSNVLQ